MRNFIRRWHLTEYGSLLMVSLILFIPIFWIFINWQGQNDYWFHISWAQSIVADPQALPAAVTAHACWQWLVLIVRQILDCQWGNAALVVTFTSQFASIVLLYWFLRKHLSALFSGALSIGLLMVAPIMFVLPLGDIPTLANGYIGANVYHNPTILLLKPFAILQFILAVDLLNNPRSNWKNILLTAVVSAAAAFSKPSYVICLLPALGILVLVRLFRKQALDWAKLILGFVLPSVAFLIWQYLITFGPDADSSVIFAPLMVMNHFSNNLLVKWLLSVAFPLFVTVLYIKDAVKDRKMQLGWLGFIVACLYTYLLAETGTRQFSANFVWSAEISLFLLFVSSVLFLAEKIKLQQSPVRRWFILASGFIHIVFGIAHYAFITYSLYLLQYRWLG